MKIKRRTEPLLIQPAEGLDDYHDFSKAEDLAAYRAVLAKSNLLEGKLPEDVTESWHQADGVRYARLSVTDAADSDLIFHIHGGFWNGGVPCTGQRAFVELAAEEKINLISVEYGLAPEHPFPDGLNDCVKVYRKLLQDGYDPEHIIFLGESAGGNLCLALGLYLKDHQLPLPGGMVLLSPLTLEYDFETAERALRENPKNLKLSEEITSYRIYIQDASPKNPYIFPIYGDFSGFPPVLIQFGGSEFLHRDGVELTHKMMLAGVDVESHCWEFMPHVHVLLQDVIPEAAAAKEEIKRFLHHMLP